MELYSVKLSSLVYIDLEHIKKYAEDELYISPEKFLKKFYSSLEMIKMFPFSNPAFTNWRGEEFRKIVLFKKYTIMYKVNEDEKEIEVYRIFHQSQDWYYKIID